LQIAISAPVDITALAPYLEGTSGCMPRGLGSTATTPLVAELLNRGHEVSVFTLDSEVEKELILRGSQLRIFVGPYRKSSRGRDFFQAEIEYLTRAVRRESPKFVHAHWTYEFALGALRAGANTVVTIHDLPWVVLRFLPDCYRAARLCMALQVARCKATFTAVSSDAARHFRKYLFGTQTIEVVPNFLPLRVLQMGKTIVPSHRQGLTFGSVLQGWTGTKNASSLLAAFSVARKALPNSRLIMIGSGYAPGGPAYSWARAKGLDSDVTFIGPLAHAEMLRTVQEHVDILVHPSRHEALSVTVMEAMAMGKPIIAGRHTPGQRFLLEEGNCGVLVDVGRVDALAQAMIQLARSSQNRERLGSRARASAWARFHPDVVLPMYEHIYSQLLHA
jgi:glycosyltransferase involved in cell wall biosynthesis